MQQKHPYNESIDLENINGSTSTGVNRTGSAFGLSSNHLHLQKPVMFRSSSADQPTHPLIVLQKAPVISHSETSLATNHTSTDTKTGRHHRQQHKPPPQCSDEELSPLNLEQIVIHSLPKAPVRRGILRREDTVTSNASSVSFSDDPHHGQ